MYLQDLATIDVLRDIRLSLLCQLWYVTCVYTYAHTRTLITNIAREYILYSAWASRCQFQDTRQCEGLEVWNDNSRIPRFFYMPLRLDISIKQSTEYAENPIKSRQIIN